MSKGKETVRDVIGRLLSLQGSVTSGQVAAEARVTRQAAHYNLKAMADEGLLEHVGAGRGAHFVRLAQFERTYDLRGLVEHTVWTEEWFMLKQQDLPVFDNPLVKPILDFTFTEMLNNAIDHSNGTTATVRWFTDDPDRIAFEIIDDGIGVFESVLSSRQLGTESEALVELSKGRQTTYPERHSGLGIYYSSRAATRFVLASGHLVWTTDNSRHDEAAGWASTRRTGTYVRTEVSGHTDVRMVDVFGVMNLPDSGGLRTTVRLSLFGAGDFVSRSEAKVVGANLERFSLVEIDFTGIDAVGQGFVDELFRVWQLDHPETRLVATNANPAIRALLDDTLRRPR